MTILKSKIYSLSDDQFKTLVSNSHCYSYILEQLGVSKVGGTSTKILKKRIQELKCDISHFNLGKNKGQTKKQSLSDILVSNSTYTNISRLKIRLVKEGYLEYSCKCCGNDGSWNGKTLVLQLDHIDGVNNNHSINNLRFLCPNCHSQTDTYAGKNSGR